ncbi:chloride channel protein [Roseospira goensis]|uniref:CIC family chloride channel protein n=1 Tax=Roseospira goensis TaxID=391922 RepID=A0A7W6WLG1_9PROT|nr:chloride channel protein [Roseospira goensis]MBB4287386.1 CIC family chloride channel protein [Roseospira goensis]
MSRSDPPSLSRIARSLRRHVRLTAARLAAAGPHRRVVNDHMVLAVLAMTVGLLTGGGIILFREGIVLLQALLYAGDAQHLATAAAALPWWALVVLPTVGGLVVGLWHQATLPQGRPENVSHVMEAAILRGGRMSLRRGLAAIVGSMLSLGVGASVGREGPAVHLGATLGAWVARLPRFGRGHARTLLGCGAAAAVAASFNAPIAGALFAHEVVIAHYATSAFAPVVISSVAATVVSRLWFGTAPAFALPPDLAMASVLEFPAVGLLGVVCGLVAAAFLAALQGTDAVARRSGLPVWMRPAAAGLAVGLIATAFPEVLGVGYEVTNRALSGDLLFDAAVAIALAKVVATVICLGFGFGGGVFSPSMVIGAVTGCAFGVLATAAVPGGWSAGPGAYAVVGMGAVAAAVLGAPISTSLIIFELTGNYELTVAVMVAVVLATVVSHGLTGHRSQFHWQLARRGLDVEGDRQRQMLRDIRVRDLVTLDAPTVPADAGLEAVAAAFRRAGADRLFVVDAERRLLGMIVLADAASALLDRGGDSDRAALDLAQTDPPVLALSETLDEAMETLEELREACIPVVHDRESMTLVGSVQDRDLMRAYARTLDRLRAEDRGER